MQTELEGDAQERSARAGSSPLSAQHRHAHMASCMAENRLDESVIGVTFDGTGFGSDGAVWGGEFLVGDYRKFHRSTHLRYVGMPGGEQAVREPWRMALSRLCDAGISAELQGTTLAKRVANVRADAPAAFSHTAYFEHGTVVRPSHHLPE